MMNAFSETKNLFIAHVQYTGPVSYSEWLEFPDDHKAAVLFIQFFDQITLAWYKTKSFFVLEEDGVSIVLQYLSKNVPILKDNPKRFTPAYIYKVAYNCLYCISHDIKRDIERFENEVSNIVGCGDNQLDLFDTVCSPRDLYHEVCKADFWDIIESSSLETKKVINHLLNGEPLDRVKSRSAKYANDPLKDIEVSVDQMEIIIAELREKLNNFVDLF